MEKEEEEREKVKGKFGIIFTIFVTGLVAGIFSGIAKNIGQNVSLDSLLIKSVGYFCDVIKSLLSDTSSSECGINFTYLAIILGILGVIEIVLTASKLKNWLLGLIIFGVGYLIGFILALVI